MSLEKKISQDYIEAMKAKDKVKSATLSFLRAKIKDVRINERLEEVSDEKVITVIKKQVKQRKDSIEQFKTGGRDDLLEKESAELKILQQYLPEELGDEALQEIIKTVIAELNASSMKDMGKVIKAVIEKTKGQADNKRISEVVKGLLQ